MSIAIMKEGEVMGRGVPRNFIQEQQLKQRLAANGPETIAVIGAGPAGLLAAHAVALAGREPVIFSAPDADGAPAKSELGAATYLHEAIPDLTSAEPDAMIRFVKEGTSAGYALKVYGDRNAPCSWSKFEAGYYPAWAMQPAYDELWKLYQDRIVPHKVSPSDLHDFVDSFPAVVSTIPAIAICEENHAFPARPIWVTDDPGLAANYQDPCIVYDGTVGTVAGRYRSSVIFGHSNTEYAQVVEGAREGIKVLPTDCDCHPEVMRAGRWGEWQPGILVNHAFHKVWTAMFDSFEGA